MRLTCEPKMAELPRDSQTPGQEPADANFVTHASFLTGRMHSKIWIDCNVHKPLYRQIVHEVGYHDFTLENPGVREQRSLKRSRAKVGRW